MAFPKNKSKCLTIETQMQFQPYGPWRLTALHTYNKSCTLNVIYNIRAISHLVQEITRQKEGERKRKEQIPHPACENLCQISPQTRSPSLGLASMPRLGNRIRCRTATNLFLSQQRCSLGLHGHCVYNTSTFSFFSSCSFTESLLIYLWWDWRSSE